MSPTFISCILHITLPHIFSILHDRALSLSHLTIKFHYMVATQGNLFNISFFLSRCIPIHGEWISWCSKLLSHVDSWCFDVILLLEVDFSWIFCGGNIYSMLWMISKIKVLGQRYGAFDRVSLVTLSILVCFLDGNVIFDEEFRIACVEVMILHTYHFKCQDSNFLVYFGW